MKLSFSVASRSTALWIFRSSSSQRSFMGLSAHIPTVPEEAAAFRLGCGNLESLHPRRRPGHPDPPPRHLVLGAWRGSSLGKVVQLRARRSPAGGRRPGWVAATRGHPTRGDLTCVFVSIFHSDGEFLVSKSQSISKRAPGGAS